MEDLAPNELLSKETRELFIMATRIITEDWVKVEIMKSCADIPTLEKALEDAYSRINWMSRDSILPLVPTLELIYRHTPRTLLNVPQKLDVALAKDGYQVKRGRLVRLRL